jgi:hypothetical protein
MISLSETLHIEGNSVSGRGFKLFENNLFLEMLYFPLKPWKQTEILPPIEILCSDEKF